MGAELSPGTGVAGIFLPDSRPNALQEASAVLQGAAFAAAPVAVVEVTGPGAVQCMQGLVTNDLETGGNTSFQYGALLTTKGMIVCDMWIARNDASLTLYPDLLGKEALLLVLERSLPPQFATVTDRSEKRAVLRLVGRNATEVATRTGFTLPSEGNADAKTTQTTARPNSIAPFSLQIDCADGDVDVAVSSLSTAGATAASPDVLELARILGGWPRLGAEIDDKTLPQEVRYDELRGVSYTPRPRNRSAASPSRPYEQASAGLEARYHAGHIRSCSEAWRSDCRSTDERGVVWTGTWPLRTRDDSK
jgi:folate-binding Fe-S cluster repair protein YgfZ